jgi:hypothetical protein
VALIWFVKHDGESISGTTIKKLPSLSSLKMGKDFLRKQCIMLTNCVVFMDIEGPIYIFWGVGVERLHFLKHPIRYFRSSTPQQKKLAKATGHESRGVPRPDVV